MNNTLDDLLGITAETLDLGAKAASWQLFSFTTGL
jgi:hypothetical protein